MILFHIDADTFWVIYDSAKWNSAIWDSSKWDWTGNPMTMS